MEANKKLVFKTLILTVLTTGFILPVFSQTASVRAPLLARSLYIGIKGDDVKLLQEFLAQDKEIYPEGLITGYFGKLTEAAVKKWQAKYGIESVGIVGPKTRAKFKELNEAAAAVVTPLPVPKEEPVSTPTPPVLEPVSPPSPTATIKTGTGEVSNNQYFNIGNAQFLYAGGDGYYGRGYLSPGDPASLIANITRSEPSSCESISSKGYLGISNICQFTNPSSYEFGEHKDFIRIYDKSASAFNAVINKRFYCYQGIMLFKRGNIYGAIDPEDVDGSGILHYRYWYDESGGTNFGNLCATYRETVNKLASVLESLNSLLQKLSELVK